MSVQTEINRIKNCVSEQTQLIEQIKTVLEKKASPKKGEITVEISVNSSTILYYSNNEVVIDAGATETFAIEKDSIIYLKPNTGISKLAFNHNSSVVKTISSTTQGIALYIPEDAEIYIIIEVVTTGPVKPPTPSF